MVDKELIGIWRNMLKPSISSWLLKTNYEGLGEQDKEEFECDFDEILDLALIGLKHKEQFSQEGTTKDATSDTISRQAAIDEIEYVKAMKRTAGMTYTQHLLKNWRVAFHALNDFFAHFIHGLIPAIKIRHHQPCAQPEPQWIPCDETVDIPDHEVMACDRYGEFIIGYLDRKDEQWTCESDNNLMYDPIAWRELPKPYKEGVF